MKIILQKEIEKLGAPGDVVSVADGYARNFLIPKGLAMAASKGAVRHAERLKKAHHERTAKAVQEAQELAGRLSARTLRLSAKAGEEGRLFGAITAADLANELERVAGTPIDRKRIHLDHPIKSVGMHEVVVHLHPEVDAAVSVEIVPQ
jgi:large subunit ribosomal protein L9